MILKDVIWYNKLNNKGGSKMNEQVISKVGKEVTESMLECYGDKVSKIILYGSYARGDNREDSDMDLIVLFDRPYKEVITYRKDVSKIASRVGLKNDIMVSIVFRDVKSFNEDKDILPFYQNIVKEGYTIYG